MVVVVRVGARSRIDDEKKKKAVEGPGEAHTLLVCVVETEVVRVGEPRRLRWPATTMLHRRWHLCAGKDCLI